MPFYTSEQILNQAFDSETGTLKTSNDQLGTPGTGEPAHAGGSTGLIGWARDILAKIAAFGTSGVPSANVISVQGPPNQLTTMVFTGNGQTLTLNCEGMGGANFYCRVAGTATYQIQLDFGNGVWEVAEYAIHTAAATTPAMQYAAASFLVNQWAVVNTRGAKLVRLITISYTSTSTFDGVVSPSAGILATEITQFNNVAVLPTVTTVGTVTTPSNCSVYYTDTTTPLAANALFIGSTRAMLAGNNKFNSLAVSDLGSTTNGFFTQGSTDVGTTWRNHKLLTMPASDPTPSEVQRTVNSYRIGFQNGASAQTFFSLTSSQTPN